MATESTTSFGELLRRTRIAAGMTQEGLAERSGVSVRGIGDLERGIIRAPRRDTLALLADALDISDDERSRWERLRRRLSVRSMSRTSTSQGRDGPLTNLPEPLSILIGRETDIARVATFLGRSEVRLLTLTGVGGVGKTRVAIAAASALVSDFTDGVWFVDVAPIRDAELVVAAIARTLNVGAMSSQPIGESLRAYLRDKQMLLVLDNFEQVADAAPVVTGLLEHARQVKLLVTSRVALRMSGEQEYLISPLAVPDATLMPPGTSLSQYAAIALFRQRAQEARANIQIKHEDESVVAEICRRLDGLPLAIELAAARVKVLDLRSMLARLDQPLSLLGSGARDLPERQRTIRNTIQWSYDLLDSVEQTLIRHLSVFAGGWTLGAAEAVVGGDDGSGIDVLDGLASLVGKSLIVQREQPDGSLRFGMLETIRTFVLEHLEADEAPTSAFKAHAQYFVTLAEQAEPFLVSAERERWLSHLDDEYANIRAALDWCVVNDVELGLRLAGAVGWHWYLRGYHYEGREWFERLGVTHLVPMSESVRAKALTSAARLAFYAHDRDNDEALAAEGVRLWREVGDRRGLAHALVVLALPRQFSSAGGAIELHESLRLCREIDDEWGEAQALLYLGAFSILRRGEHPVDRATARAYLNESSAILRRLGDDWQRGAVLSYLALAAEEDGHDHLAREFHEASIELFRNSGDRWREMIALSRVGQLLLRQGEYERACETYELRLEIVRHLGDRAETAKSLEALGYVLLRQGDVERAERVYRESLSLSRDVGFDDYVARGLQGMGDVALFRGKLEAALTLYRDALAMLSGVSPSARLLKDTQPVPGCITGCALALWRSGRQEPAARLLGWIDAWWEVNGLPQLAAENVRYQAEITVIRSALESDAQRSSWLAGQKMPLDEAIALACHT